VLTTTTEPLDAERLEREATRLLAAALGTRATLHEPGGRARYRELLEGAIERATRALEVAPRSTARSTLAEAHAAKAEDALHGAGQLSLSAQRAPTLDACDDGWRRVEAIVAGAETSAGVAAAVAAELEAEAKSHSSARKARAAARTAEDAARAARSLIEGRNHAYTFHTDGGFSFGEGWYLAAAAVLAGVDIQIEPSKDGTVQAETFLRAAGLGPRLKEYRSRPRAMKHTTELVGRAFRADPVAAQRALRGAFLGDTEVPPAIADYVDRRLARLGPERAGRRTVLVWIRDGVHHANRNTTRDELLALTASIEQAGLVPLWTGDAAPGGPIPDGVVDLILFWKDPLFRGDDQRRAQLHFFEHLKARHGLVGQLGVTTAGMDGPALMGLPTLYLTDAPNVRMREWVGAVPEYREIVRDDGYLERVARALSGWAAG
jgi:hypothetical protein